MQAKIDLITIWTSQIEPMKNFYSKILGFTIKEDLGEYIEFDNEGVRFALCNRTVMADYNPAFKQKCSGQAFELAFPCKKPNEVDKSYENLINKGVKGIHEPQDMPWNMRTALFADPDGNIHELFCRL